MNNLPDRGDVSFARVRFLIVVYIFVGITILLNL